MPHPGLNHNDSENIRCAQLLLACIAGGHSDIIDLLLARGADVHAKGDMSDEGETALTMAIEKGRQDVRLLSPTLDNLDTRRIIIATRKRDGH